MKDENKDKVIDSNSTSGEYVYTPTVSTSMPYNYTYNEAGQRVINLADPWKRIGAWIIDWLIIIIATIPFSIIAGLILFSNSGLEYGTTRDFEYLVELYSDSVLINILSTILGVTLYTFIFILTPSFFTKGQTLGKKMMNIKMVRADGKDAEVQDFLKRYGLYYLLFIPLLNVIVVILLPFLLLASVIMMFVDSKRQNVFDKASDVIVIDAN